MTSLFKEWKVYQNGLDFSVDVIGEIDSRIKTDESHNPSSAPYDGLRPISDDLWANPCAAL